MTTLVGLGAGKDATATINLAGMISRTIGGKIVLCSVVTEVWPPSPDRMDHDYRVYLERAAAAAVADGQRRLPADADVAVRVHHAKSVAAGLLEVAQEEHAQVVVLGSSSVGTFGQVTLGSGVSRLLHSAHLPVAIAPRGFRTPSTVQVDRATLAYGGGDSANDLVPAAVAISRFAGTSLRIASFTVHPAASFAGSIEPSADDLVARAWLARSVEAIHAELDELRAAQFSDREVEIVLGQGSTWQEAIEDISWDRGDVLIVGSSSAGPVDLVFLGSRSAKIIRHAPVPVIVVPRRSPLATDS